MSMLRWLVRCSLLYCVVWQLKAAGKDCKISGFSDQVISRGRVIIDLIDAIKPGSVKYNVVKAGDNDEVRYITACTVVQAVI